MNTKDRAQQRVLLEAHRDEVTLAFFQELKSRSDARALEEPARALEIAEVANVAASLVDIPLGEALAYWARGNALLCLEEHERALDDYGLACERYREQDREEHRLEIARLQTNMVAVLKSLGRYAEALELAEEARTTLEPWPDSRYMATLEMNAGSLYRHVGRYPEALAAYERGRAIFAALGHTVQAARMDVNRARLLGIMDRFRGAETLLREAHEVLAAEGADLPAARADLNRATLLSRQGRHRQALGMYRRVRVAFAELGVEVDVATTDLYASYDYLALNLLPEAAESAAAAREMLSERGMSRYVALANGNWAVAARKRGHYAEALDALDEARRFFAEQEIPIEVALLDLERALCQREMGDVEAAAAVAREATRVIAGHDRPFQSARGRLVLGDCLLHLGQIERAGDQYELAMETLEQVPSLAWEAHDGLGRAAEAREELRSAYEHYRAAIDCIEEAEDTLGSAEFRAGFLEDKLDVYRRAVRSALALGEQEQVFCLVEQAKTGVWRAFLTHPEEDLPRDLDTLRRQWYWLYHRLHRPDEDDEGRAPDTFVGAGDYERGSKAERLYWDDLRALERRIVRARRAASPLLDRAAGPTLAAVQRSIPEDTVLLDYYCAGEMICALTLGRSGVRTCGDLAPLRDVERQLNRWRFNLESARLAILDGRPAVELADEAHAVLQALYGLLVAPLEPDLVDARSLWISPHAALWAVPFTALYDGDHYLIERWTLTCLPGMIGLKRSERESPILTDAPVVVGYSDGERLSYAVSEARTVAAALGMGKGELLLEEEVTEEHLRCAAESCTLLHLATHGFFREDAPLFSALHLADDLLTAERLEGWRMPRVDLVTLSACETGVRLSRGSDLLGLARGFWRAGARRLVVSLWAVDDVSTADLMVHFYKGLREGKSPARALRSAQIAALTKYRHPFYWAGFEALEVV